MKRVRFILCSLLILLSSVMYAQMESPVTVTVETKDISATEAMLIFKATIEKGWHMYSVDEVKYGPTPTSLKIEQIEGATLDGNLAPQGAPVRVYDEMFQAEVSYFENSAVYIQKLKLQDKHYKVVGYLEYGACNDHSCIPPTKTEFDITRENTLTDKKKDDTEDETELTDEVLPETDVVSDVSEAHEDSIKVDTLSRSEISSAIPPVTTSSPSNILSIFLMGLVGGLLALLTPCVWPMIPMTVSFFIKRAKNRTNAISDALVYGVSIVVIYLILGLAVTALFGANALNAMSTNAWFNIFFFLLLVIFALSFFGLFELQLPASWSTSIDNKAEKTSGLLGIFLMAFTLTIVSFSCTGPIIGFLLVEVASMGNLYGPAVGMLGFALGLAIPFALFAMFPKWLDKMPKSGNWMNTLKVILGFVELFFSLKFFSVADLAYGWHILDRDIFIALWIILALALGAYLVGLYHFPHETKVKKVGWGRWLLGLISFAFAIWMIPGLWGEPLKAISAFTPPMSTQHWKRVNKEITARAYDFSEGIELAKKENKPVIIDFTGYGCVNCRKMEAAVWTEPEVMRILQDEYVLIQLFVDDKTPLPEVVEVSEGDKTRKLRTVGDKWSYLQSSKFGANAQPFYVLLNPFTEQLLSEPYGFDEDTDHYIDFLNKGLANMKKQ